MRSKKMNNEFLEYIENKIAIGSGKELEFDKTLLSLYKKGFVSIRMEDGQPLVSMTDGGTSAYMNEVALSLVDVGVA